MSRSILIVDDDEDIRGSLSDYFADQGYVVGQAANGRDALAYLQAHPATSIVLLDLVMPVMTGYEVLAAKRADAALASIPVLVMSARGTFKPGEVEAEVLHKPLKLAKLLDAIERTARSG